MHLIDTHQHLWDPARFAYSWCAGIPALNRPFLPTAYADAAHDTPVTRTIFVECDVDSPHAFAEARYIQQLADSLPSSAPAIAGIVACAHPESPDFAAELQPLLGLTRLRGIRRVLHTQPDDLCLTPLFAENLRRLPALGLTFDLCVLPRQLRNALDLVRRCPGVTFILDHCGIPDVRGRALDPWRADLAALAAEPNVNCKISGLVAYADPRHWTAADLRPFVDHTLAVFGWDRVVWGGDWPVCTLAAPLARWVTATAELTASAAPADLARLFHLNAERIYRV